MSGAITIKGSRCGRFPISLVRDKVFVPEHLTKENVLLDLKEALHSLKASHSPIQLEIELVQEILSIVESDDSPQSVVVKKDLHPEEATLENKDFIASPETMVPIASKSSQSSFNNQTNEGTIDRPNEASNETGELKSEEFPQAS